jgi:DNA-binding response OmpR family regulator
MQALILVESSKSIGKSLVSTLATLGFEVIQSTHFNLYTVRSDQITLTVPRTDLDVTLVREWLHAINQEADHIPVYVITKKKFDKSAIKKAKPKALSKSSQKPLMLGRLEIYKDQAIVKYNGIRLHLTPREFNLIAFFSENPGLVFSRDELLDIVWGDGYTGKRRTVDQHISQIRAYIGKEAIETIRDRGYRLNPDFFVEPQIQDGS